MPHTRRTQSWKTRVINPTIRRLSHTPARAMTGTGTRRDAKTTALGGVATGRMKAADAAIAAGVGPEADALWTEVSRVVHELALTCGRMASTENIVWNQDVVTGVQASGHVFEPKLIDYKALRPAE